MASGWLVDILHKMLVSNYSILVQTLAQKFCVLNLGLYAFLDLSAFRTGGLIQGLLMLYQPTSYVPQNWRVILNKRRQSIPY